MKFLKKINSYPFVRKIRSRISLYLLGKIIPDLYPIIPGKPLIRVGPAGDGGYLVPDDLDGISACFSPGVSLISGFELQCAQHGMDVFLADASVDAPEHDHPRFHFRDTFIGDKTIENFITMDD